MHRLDLTGWSKSTRVLRQAIWPVLVVLASMPSLYTAAAQHRSNSGSTPPDSALVLQARKLIQQRDPQGALSLLEQADPRATDTSEIHTLKGICFAMTAKPIESSAEFDRAIALRPDYAPAYFSAGLAAASFNNLDRAVTMLADALRLDPNLPGLRYNYALALARDGKYADSEKQVDAALARKNLSIVDARQLWELKARDAYYEKNWQDTLVSCQKALQLHPDWAGAYAPLGEALYHLNRAQASEVALRKALDLDPQNETAHRILGMLYQNQGQPDKAIAQFEAALQLAPTDREAMYRLLRVYSSKGEAAKAEGLQKRLQKLTAANSAESIDEAKAAALNNAGIELEKKGDYAGALDDYNQAAKADVTNIVFERNAALLLCKMGRIRQALSLLQDILSMDSDDAETLQIMAVAKELASGHMENKHRLPEPQSSH